MKTLRLLSLVAVLMASSPILAIGQSVVEVARSDIRGLRSGLVLGVYHAGQLDFLGAFGKSGPEASDSLDADRLFAFPALGEVFLGTTVQALAHAGVLDLEVPISRYLPLLSPRLGRIHMSQLLTHTSGLDDAAIPEDQEWSEAVDLLNDQAMFTEPGFIYSRSRYSFPLLRRVVEKIVGSPFKDIAAQAILTPLGLTRSTFDPTVALELGLATGVAPNRDASSPYALVEPKAELNGLPVVFTTATDLIQFLASWMNGGIRGTPPWAAKAEEDPGRITGDTGFRSGVSIGEYEGLVRASRSASGLGMGAVFYLFPNEDAAVVSWGIGSRPARTTNLALERVAAAVRTEPETADQALARVASKLGVPLPQEADDSTEADGPKPTLPPHEKGWAGMYLNGEYKVELKAGDDGLVYFTGDDELPVTPGEGGAATAIREDGRVRVAFRLENDRAGRRYVRLGTKAFLHTGDSNWRPEP